MGKTLSPAVREFLVHCIECEGWLSDDPVRIPLSTVEAAERRGLVVVERFDGRITSARITARGRAEFVWFWSGQPSQPEGDSHE